VTVVEAGPQVDRGVALNRLERAAVRVPEAPYEIAPYAESPATIKDTYIQQDGPDPFRSTYLRLVGGTTWHWLGTALRLLPSDLELRSRYGVGEDWPLRYSDLAPWYDAAESELGVSGPDDDFLGPPRQKPYPMPGLPAALGDRLIEQIAGGFGFKVRVSPQARNSRPFDGRPACCASSSCIPICPVQAKYDATVHLRKAEVGNQGWEWAGPDLASLAKEYVDAGLSGLELLNAVRSHSSREMTLVALTEQLPDPNNRITPDFDRLDAIGVPKPRVFFRLDDYTASALAAARNMHEQLFHAVGATEIGHLPYAEGAGHIMGTTRMGTMPGHRWLPRRAKATIIPICGSPARRCFRHRVRRTRP
jgi:choline dehydrogenase-like flavoprotein